MTEDYLLVRYGASLTLLSDYDGTNDISQFELAKEQNKKKDSINIHEFPNQNIL